MESCAETWPWFGPGAQADGYSNSQSNAALVRSSAPIRWKAAPLGRLPMDRGCGGNGPIEVAATGWPSAVLFMDPSVELGSFVFYSDVWARRGLFAPATACYRAPQLKAPGVEGWHGFGGTRKEPGTERGHDGKIQGCGRH